uniref:Uncharacterized protein n=1 Tax=Corticoviridae sp. TaxID=2832474 RepID=A0A8D9UHE4_9VIRU|nr:MAG TPA: hypothetical protein [Corticoviridae sp.]
MATTKKPGISGLFYFFLKRPFAVRAGVRRFFVLCFLVVRLRAVMVSLSCC